MKIIKSTKIITLTQDYGDEVRGCHATTAIEEEEIIVEVPLKCLITVEMGKETQVRGAVNRYHTVCGKPVYTV